MKKIVVFICVMTIVTSTVVFAGDLNQKTVSDVVEKIKAGKKVSALESYPSDQTQIFTFGQEWPGRLSIYYYIDMRAKLCFVGTGLAAGSISPVPCKSLKDGYPLIAPIIDWEK